jgi:predicted transcriptional regulator
MYPGIAKWYETRVYPGLIRRNRVAFIGYFNERPAVSAIIKNRERSKICHIHIQDEFQGMHLGELFFSLMALEVRTIAKSVHITMPEGLWKRQGEFFKSFAFHRAQIHGVQYRADEWEFISSTPYREFWAAAREKFPKIYDHFSVGGYALGDGLLFSIKPKWAHQIVEGKKKVEIRKKFDRRWEGRTIKIYSSSPDQCILGEATIDRVDTGSPASIWERYSAQTGCTPDEFTEYVGLAENICAIVLREVRPYKEWIPLSLLEHLTQKDLVPPQSYCTLKNNKNWSEAVSIAAILQGGLKNAQPIVLNV